MMTPEQVKLLSAVARSRKPLTSAARKALKDIAQSLQYGIQRRADDDAKHAALMEIGKGAYESIADMVAALECDYDRLEELRELKNERADVFDAANPWPNINMMPEAHTCGCGLYVHPSAYNSKAVHIEDCPFHALTTWDAEHAEDMKELLELEKAAGDCESRDDAEQRIHEDALSVEVRTDWHSPGTDDKAPDAFNILLTTGGPAVRIMGELNEHAEPYRAWLEVQDWGTPWTEYCDADSGVLLAYARCFYFGEG